MAAVGIALKNNKNVKKNYIFINHSFVCNGSKETKQTFNDATKLYKCVSVSNNSQRDQNIINKKP